MIDQGEKPHISATQLEMWWKCQEQWRRRYVEREVIPPGMALLQGKSYHSAAEANGRQKIDSHADLPGVDIVEVAVSSFEAGVIEGYELTKAEAARGAKVVLGENKDQVAALAALYALEQAPDYQPVMVEHRSRIVLSQASHDILAVTDLIDDQHRVVDFKTAKRKQPQSAADESTQLTIYAAACLRESGREPAEVRLDCAVKNKTPSRQVLSSHRSKGDYAALAKRIDATIAAITAACKGDVPFCPASPGAWWCGANWCGYYRTCEFVNSSRQ